MKIVVADPQVRVRSSLRILLGQQGCMVGGEAADCHELFDLLGRQSPDLLLVDMALPGLQPEDLLCRLRTEHPRMRIIAMSGRQELAQVAVTAGADAFACKAESPEKLLNLIREQQARMDTLITNSGGAENNALTQE